MKILFLSHYFYPHIGGVEKHVFEICRRLIKKGHDVQILCESTGNEKQPNEVYKGVKIQRIPSYPMGFAKKFRIWFYIYKHKYLIENCDIIHCHDVFFWYLPFHFLYNKKKVFTTFHGYEGYPVKSKNFLIRKISEKLSDGNICIGDFITKWYKTKPDFISYGGVDVDKLRAQPFDFVQGKSSKSRVIKVGALFIGRLDEQTGILTYCKVVKLLKNSIPNFKFLIAGDGRYRKLAEKEGIVTGFVENPEKMLSEYRFAFVSRYLSILEALAAKRLIFALYDNPIKRDYLIMSPFSRHIIICSSAKDLAEKVLFYMKSPGEERKIIDSGYEWVKSQTWDSVTNLYLTLWCKDV